jgi:hypothetical protein
MDLGGYLVPVASIRETRDAPVIQPLAHRRALAPPTTFVVALALLFCVCSVEGGFLAATSLERCVVTASFNATNWASSPDGAEPTLVTRCTGGQMVLTLTVNTGDSLTEAFEAITVSNATDPVTGLTFQPEDTLEISLVKSKVTLRYPLSYERDFNNKPYEIYLRKDQSGLNLDSFYNPCQDAASSSTATCGWATDGRKVPFSNGFCCSCPGLIGTLFPQARVGKERGALSCGAFTAPQSAHCLRMQPLWYQAFNVGPPQTVFTVDVYVTRCKPSPSPSSAASTQQPSSEPTPARARNGTDSGIVRRLQAKLRALQVTSGGTCTQDVLTISPTMPGACHYFAGSAAPSPPPANASAPAPGICDVAVALEGDFAPFQEARSLEEKYLMVPRCRSSDASGDAWCVARQMEVYDYATAGRVMILDKVLFTPSGQECNKIGVSYEAFSLQPNSCIAPQQTCLSNQPDDFYHIDLQAQKASLKLKYFADAFRETPAARFYFTINAGSSDDMRLEFQTLRFQKSVITVTIPAMAVRWKVMVSPAKILDTELPTFAGASEKGQMACRIKNIGALRSQYTLSVSCTGGIKPVVAQQVTLAAFETSTVYFAIESESLIGRAYMCSVRLLDAYYSAIDTADIVFNTTTTPTDDGSQGGTLPSGAPMASVLRGNSTSRTCDELCTSSMDIACAIKHRCLSKAAKFLTGLIVGLLGIGLLAAVCIKFPCLFLGIKAFGGTLFSCICRCLCAPFAALSAAASTKQKPTKQREETSHRQHEHRHRQNGACKDGEGNGNDNKTDEQLGPWQRVGRDVPIITTSPLTFVHVRPKKAVLVAAHTIRGSKGGADGCHITSTCGGEQSCSQTYATL